MNCLIELYFDQIGSFISFLWFPFYFLVSFGFFFPFHMAYFLLLRSLPFESDKDTCKASCFFFLGFRYFSLPRTLSSILGGMMRYISILFPFFSWEVVSQAVVWWFSSVLDEFFPASIVCASSGLSMFLELLCLLLTCVFVLTFCPLIFPSLSFLVCSVWVLEDLHWFRAATISFFRSFSLFAHCFCCLHYFLALDLLIGFLCCSFGSCRLIQFSLGWAFVVFVIYNRFVTLYFMGQHLFIYWFYIHFLCLSLCFLCCCFFYFCLVFMLPLFSFCCLLLICCFVIVLAPWVIVLCCKFMIVVYMNWLLFYTKLRCPTCVCFILKLASMMQGMRAASF